MSEQFPGNLLPILVLAFFAACGAPGSGQDHYQPPEPRSDQLEVASAETVGLDTVLIKKAIHRMNSGKYKELHSFLVFKDGKLVVEAYFPGHEYQWEARNHHGALIEWSADKAHSIHSVTKSITSLCIGIAIDHGFIQNVNESIFNYLPDHQQYKRDGKDAITIRHLLTCTSGIQWAEWNAPLTSRKNDQIDIWFYEDGPLPYYLQRPLIATPGTHFTYSGGGIDVLGEILKNASGVPISEFSQEYLFDPMGITSAEWVLQYPTGEWGAHGGLKLAPRDMLKIGAMMLNKGIWDGERIISSNWVENSQTPYVPNHVIQVPNEDLPKMGYSYTWWTLEQPHSDATINSYSAIGWGGQKIIVLPEVDMVVVFTGANYKGKIRHHSIIEKYILGP